MVAISPSSRSTIYNPVNETGPFPVGFPVFDGTGADLVILLNGTVMSGWTFTADQESGFYGAPNTWVNGTISFASPITGRLNIKGKRSSRRQGQFAEGRGVPARDQNTEWNILTAKDQELDRDIVDFGLRSFRVPDGEIAPELPSAALREGKFAFFGVGGDLTAVTPDNLTLDGNQVWRILDVVTAFGAAPGGIIDCSAAFAAAILAGGDIFVPPGVYRIAQRSWVTLARDAKLTFAPNARIVADAGLLKQAFVIDGDNQFRFFAEGGQFDFSAVPQGVPPEFDKGTCWELIDLPWFSIRGGRYIAGSSYDDLTGDAAIACTNSAGEVLGNWFDGWPDSGIYITGGGLPDDESDDGGPTFVRGNIFDGCSLGVSIKRRNPHALITGNMFRRCRAGIGTYGVGSGELEPGDRLIVSGNHFLRNQRDIEFRGGFGEAIVSGNSFEDFGYLLDGTTPASIRVSVGLYGSRDCVVSDNRFIMRELAGTNQHIAILVDNFTVSGGDSYVASGNAGRGNIVRGLDRAVFEGSGVGKSLFLAWDCSTLSGSSIFTFTNARSEFSGHAIWPATSDAAYRHYRNASLLQEL